MNVESINQLINHLADDDGYVRAPDSAVKYLVNSLPKGSTFIPQMFLEWLKLTPEACESHRPDPETIHSQDLYPGIPSPQPAQADQVAQVTDHAPEPVDPNSIRINRKGLWIACKIEKIVGSLIYIALDDGHLKIKKAIRLSDVHPDDTHKIQASLIDSNFGKSGSSMPTAWLNEITGAVKQTESIPEES